VEVAAPPTSRRPGWRSASGISARTPKNTTIPIGTLTNITHSHPRLEVSAPPRNSPRPAPSPIDSTNSDIALARCAPGSVIAISSTSVLGAASAAPTPWRTRAAISIPGVTASPPKAEAATNTEIPISSARRGPMIDPTRPLSRTSPPKTSA
jgi:hypothetical protein